MLVLDSDYESDSDSDYIGEMENSDWKGIENRAPAGGSPAQAPLARHMNTNGVPETKQI